MKRNKMKYLLFHLINTLSIPSTPFSGAQATALEQGFSTTDNCIPSPETVDSFGCHNWEVRAVWPWESRFTSCSLSFRDTLTLLSCTPQLPHQQHLPVVALEYNLNSNHFRNATAPTPEKPPPASLLPSP